VARRFGWNAIEPKSFSNMTEKLLANFNLEKAIALRWALRDIVAKRIKLIPLQDDDLQTLLELGLVEMQDDQPVVTAAGLAALD
jgi:hypothetical protein